MSSGRIVSRRRFMGMVAAVPYLATGGCATGPIARARNAKMGVTDAAYANRRRSKEKFSDKLAMLEHIRGLGGGGIQTGVSGWTEASARKLRAAAEGYGMYIEGQISLPKGEADVARFERQIRVAREGGVRIFRTVCLGGRRYETFGTAAAFEKFTEGAKKRLAWGAKAARKLDVLLAVENHKDWRAEQHVELIKELKNDHVGVCLDAGNNISLLEPWEETLDKLAPHSFTTHIKDMAVAEREDGFDLAEVPLGEGLIDLKQFVRVCRKFRPEITFNLEMITRDPLPIPCLEKSYWASAVGVTERDLSAMLRWVRTHPPKKPLTRTKGMPEAKRVALEEQHVRRSYRYAQEELGL